MKNARTLVLSLLASACLLASLPAWAADPLKPAATVRDILNDAVDKKVAVRLDSHEELEGTVTTVGEHLVQLSRLSGRDYFDAYVAIDRIGAIVVRVR